MRSIRYTSQFKKDIKRIRKRSKDLDKLKTVIDVLADGKQLEARYRDHALVGNYRGTRDCHIEPDWLLIYEIYEDELILVRTGSHSDLFKK
ncbi:MAG: type II toxin-antitoxin system YafQ family toxin [Rhodothermales bacterium]